MKTEIGISKVVGKTLKAIQFSNLNGQCVLVFNDDTFTTLGIDRGFEHGDDDIEPISLDLFMFGDDRLIEADIVTKEEMEFIRSEKAAADNKRHNVAQELRDRAEYERLRARFEQD